jgi:type III secretory pathway component EscR
MNMKKTFIALMLSLFVSSWCFAESNQASPAQANADTQAQQTVKKEKTKVRKHKNIKKKTVSHKDVQTTDKK